LTARRIEARVAGNIRLAVSTAPRYQGYHWQGRCGRVMTSASACNLTGKLTMIKLYYATHTCALASHIALEEAAAEYETVRISFANEEQRKPEYLAINPKGRVPAMVTDKGILTETPAMLAFIAQSFPQAKLAPLDDPFLFAEVQAFNSYLCSTVHVAHAHRMRGHRWVDDPAAIAEMKRKVPESVGACFDLIERKMLRGPWVMGDVFTICDPYLFTLAQWLEGDGVDPSRFSKVSDHRNRMSERATVRKAIAEESA
jgi:glutathione S-transferase